MYEMNYAKLMAFRTVTASEKSLGTQSLHGGPPHFHQRWLEAVWLQRNTCRKGTPPTCRTAQRGGCKV